MFEIWKPIAGYEGLYEVSNLGRVKSLERYEIARKGVVRKRKGRILKSASDKDGYLKVTLSKEHKLKTIGVHRLVAEAFIPNPENKNTVNHKDENKNNNVVENLEWSTNGENNNHGSRNKKISEAMMNNQKISRPVVAISKKTHQKTIYPSISEATRQTGLQHSRIKQCIRGVRKSGLMAIKMILLNSREEWLEHRKKFIGGSDASAVIGLNGWKSNVQLWEEKTGLVIPEDISSKSYVQFGIGAEPIIRELFKLNYPQYKVEFVDNNSWINDKYQFAAVSHDGWIVERKTGRKGIWECKTSEIVSSMAKEKWSGRLPDNYYVQLIHSLMVREDCEFAHLTALLTWKFEDEEIYQQLRNYHIERADVEEDIQYLAAEEKKFWNQVQTGKKPNLILPEI